MSHPGVPTDAVIVKFQRSLEPIITFAPVLPESALREQGRTRTQPGNWTLPPPVSLLVLHSPSLNQYFDAETGMPIDRAGIEYRLRGLEHQFIAH
jgi:hypothetical protein